MDRREDARIRAYNGEPMATAVEEVEEDDEEDDVDDMFAISTSEKKIKVKKVKKVVVHRLSSGASNLCSCFLAETGCSGIDYDNPRLRIRSRGLLSSHSW